MKTAHHRDLLDAVGARVGMRGVEHGGGFGPTGMESMEARTLMSALTYSEFAERFDIPGLLHDLQRPGGAEYQGFGHAGLALGDLNADGFDDFAVSAPGSAFGAETTIAGAVFIFSGNDGSLLRTLSDGSSGFGFAMTNLGDMNGDGVDDLLIGSPQFDTDDNGTAEQFGRAWVYSGADGAVIRSLDGGGAADEFGYAVAFLGDLNNDGVSDFGVGAPGAGGSGEGAVTVFSGLDGAVIFSFMGEGAGHRFGAALAGADLGSATGEEGDGIYEIIIGAPGSDAAPDFEGRVYVTDGATGMFRWGSDGETARDGFGSSLAVVRVSPTRSVVLVGTPGYNRTDGETTLEDAGRVYRFEQDGMAVEEGAPLDGASAGERFGSRIMLLGDVDGGGVDDVAIIGVAGAARIYTGEDGATGTVEIPAGTDLGDSLFAIGDVDNDGFADIGSGFAAGDRFTVVSSLAVVPPTAIEVTSDNLAHMFTNAGNGRSFAVVEGRIVSFGRVVGLENGDRVLGVNNTGDLVVRSDSGQIYLVRHGDRALLQDLLEAAPADPAPNYGTFEAVRIGNGGDVIFMDTADAGDEGAVTRSWLLRGNVLTYLWNGSVRDVNADGDVLGVRSTEDGDIVVVRTAEGEETPIGLVDAYRINDSGQILGVNDDGDLVILTGDDVEVIGDLALPDGAANSEWIVRGFTGDGRVLATCRTAGEGPTPTLVDTDYLYVPGEGLHRLTDIAFDIDAGEDPANDRALRLGDDGTILTERGAFTLVADDAPWVGRDGTPLNASGNALVLAGINQYGDAVLLRRDGDAWRGSRIEIAGLAALESLDITQVLTLTHADADYVFVLTSNGVYSLRRTGAASPTVLASRLDGGEGSTQIADHATAFVSADGRVHLAGVDNAGDLVIYFENDPANPGVLVYDNLTTTHIESQGMTFHALASNLEVLVTQWGATHLFYLNDTGELFSVWIAPGMTYWTSTNISDHLVQGAVADHPELALSGEITAYSTPWGGLNLVGSSPDGDPTAIWWVPGFEGAWQHEKIYAAEGESPIVFNPATTSSYTTPWGGLNVATLQDDGDVAVFWWVPGFDSWRAETLTVAERPDDLTFSGDLTTSVTGETLNIFARGSDGDLYRLFWSPGDESTWNFENVTESVA